MGAAQNEGVDLLLRQRLQIPAGGQPGHRIVPVDPSVLHQGNEQGTGALKHPKSGIVQLQSSPEGVGPDGGGGADDPDPAVPGGSGRRIGGGFHHADGG